MNSMTKVITVSRTFPAYHPKAGQPTHFVEKMYASLADRIDGFKIPNEANAFWDWHEYYNCRLPKGHTIRAGHRFKTGDMVSLRVWGDDVNPKSGRSGPYHSKQITLAPDVHVRVWDIKIFPAEITMPQAQATTVITQIAANDGLELDDFLAWFRLSPEFKRRCLFDGQIICWDKSIQY